MYQKKTEDTSITDQKRAERSKSNLRRADLSYNNLSGANLVQGNLRGANLSFARNLTSEQIMSAQIDNTTKLPKNMRRIQEKRRH